MKKGTHATTIIKRGGKKAHSGVHTGAWKVAFADFTLAMMALFMVLWIMGSVSEEERREIVAQLNGTSIFDGSTFTPVALPDGSGSELVTAGNSGPEYSQEEKPDAKALETVLSQSEMELNQLSEAIARITSALNAQNNVTLEEIPQGLRILLQDDRQRMMFPRSSAVMTPFFRQLLTELAPAFNRIDHEIMISGHTDAAVYPESARYNNWNLSGDRALAARKVLELGGLEAKRIIQVNAMADRMLLNTDDPLSDGNRRIEIMVLTHTASEMLYQFYGQHGEKVVKPLTERLNMKAAADK